MLDFLPQSQASGPKSPDHSEVHAPVLVIPNPTKITRRRTRPFMRGVTGWVLGKLFVRVSLKG